jgi:hypothetical protein
MLAKATAVLAIVGSASAYVAPTVSALGCVCACARAGSHALEVFGQSSAPIGDLFCLGPRLFKGRKCSCFLGSSRVWELGCDAGLRVSAASFNLRCERKRVLV